MNENNYLESSNIYTTYLSRILYLHTNKIYFRLYRFRPGWLGPGWFQPSQKQVFFGCCMRLHTLLLGCFIWVQMYNKINKHKQINKVKNMIPINFDIIFETN